MIKMSPKTLMLITIVSLPLSKFQCFCCHVRIDCVDLITKHLSSDTHRSKIEQFLDNIKVPFSNEEFDKYFHAGIVLSLPNLLQLRDVTNIGYRSFCYKCCTVIKNSKTGIDLHLNSKKHVNFPCQNMQETCDQCLTKVTDLASHNNSEFHICVLDDLQAYGHRLAKESAIHRNIDIPLVVIPSCFSNVKQYRNIFNAFINKEKCVQKKLVRTLKIEKLTIKWVGPIGPNHQPKGYFDVPATDDQLFNLKLGDDLVVYLSLFSSWSMRCTLVEEADRFGKNACIQLENGTGVPLHIPYPYKIVPKWTDTTWWRMHQALKSLQKIPSRYVIDAVLGNIKFQSQYEQPEISFEAENILPLAYQHINLNASQLTAIKIALREPISVIHGPPGTGKTLVCTSILYNMVQKNPSIQILVCAPSNVAVKLLAENLHAQNIDIVRLLSKRYKYIDTSDKKFSLLNRALDQNVYLAKNYEKYEKKKMKNQEYECFDQILKDTMNKILDETNIILCTCIGSAQEDFKDKRFDIVLIDEAAQCVEPECLVPFSIHQATKIILTGDHLQLGPVIMSREAEKNGLGISLFERIMQRNIPNTLLKIQYRMAPEIAEFSSNMFYKGKLENGVSSFQRLLSPDLLPYEGKPFIFINVLGREERMNTSFFNAKEADCIMNLLKQLINNNIVKGEQIGVISCYEGQKRFLFGLINQETDQKLKTELFDVEVENVDGFQGREKDIIIFSTVRSNDKQVIGFMNNHRRVNMSLTRAKYKCFVIGNIHTLQNDRTWSALIRHVQENDCLFEELETDVNVFK